MPMKVTPQCSAISWRPSPADPAKVRCRFLLTLVDDAGATVAMDNPRRLLVPPEKENETAVETAKRVIAEQEPLKVLVAYGWDERIDFLHPEKPGAEVIGGVEHDFPREGHAFKTPGSPTEAEIQAEITAVAAHWLAQLQLPGGPLYEGPSPPVVCAPFMPEV